MGGDYTRASFAPIKGYSGVHKQQGRVSLDSEFNEFEEILDRKERAEMYDTAGQAAVPMMTPDGFKIDVTNTFKVTIGVGRAYVDGILVECFGDTTDPSKADRDDAIGGVHGPAVLYTDQPFHYTSTPTYPAPSTTPGNSDLVYLDVWQREVTVFEDEVLREVALNGPDTATRVQTAWQVKIMPGADAKSCVIPPTGWSTAVAPSTARLSTATTSTPTEPSACVIDPVGGFTGIENRLYRVEIHDGGNLGTGTKATLKWSRDNASLAATVTKIEPAPATAAPAKSRITVISTGPDCWRRFEKGDHLEVLDDDVEFAMRDKDTAGTMARVVSVNHTSGEIDVDADLASFVVHPKRHPRIRRWDLNVAKRDDPHGDDLLVDVNNGTAIELEEGITIKFGNANGDTLHAGDYWVFAARTATGTIDVLENAPPRGILHHFARLALIKINADSNPELASDCRHLFPPLAELTELYYIGGDGQEANSATATTGTDKYPLPAPLEVGVANGEHPVVGALVRFTVIAGSVDLSLTGGGAITPGIPVLTDANGVVSCQMRVDPATKKHAVRAELVDAANTNAHGLPVDFTATVPLQLQYVGGNAQAITPVPSGLALLPEPLEVAVVCGRDPAPFRKVRFNVTSGTGRLNGQPTATNVEVETNAQGIASVAWQLDATTPEQAVEAHLLAGTSPLDPPVHFRARPRAAFGYVGGDGQLAIPPNFQLASKLEVAVLDPPVKDRKVRFFIPAGIGSLSADNIGTSVVATTDDHGVAGCTWTLDGNTEVQGVVAQRLDVTQTVLLDPPVHFTARIQRQADDQGIHVVKVECPQLNPPLLRNDSEIPPAALASGIEMFFDQAVQSPMLHPRTFDSAVFIVSVDVPYPANIADQQLWDKATPDVFGVVGFTPIVLRAEIKPGGAVLLWSPGAEAQAWLVTRLFQRLFAAGIQEPRLLVRLTLLGSFIWGERFHLDGDTYGMPGKDPLGNLTLIDLQPQLIPGVGTFLSGDRRKGGDFRMWFWLKKTIKSVKTTPPVVGGPFLVTVALTEAAPPGGIRLTFTMIPAGPIVLDSIVIPEGQIEGVAKGRVAAPVGAGVQLTVGSSDGDLETVLIRRTIASVTAGHPVPGGLLFVNIGLVNPAPPGGMALKITTNPPDRIVFAPDPITIPEGASQGQAAGQVVGPSATGVRLTVTSSDGDSETITLI